MNIFGVGTTELAIIFLIMLVVAGPKRMVHWAYYIGQYVGKFRKMWSEVVDVVQKEIDEAGMDVKLPKEMPTRKNIGKYVSDLAKPYTDELDKAAKEIQNPVAESLDEANKTVKQATTYTSMTVTSKKPAKKADTKPQEKAAFGAWGETPKDKEPKPPPKSDDNGNFGAWSNPQHPGQQVEHEA